MSKKNYTSAERCDLISRVAQWTLEQALLAANDAFAVYGLSEDPDAPECCVELLDTVARKWRMK